MNEPAESTKEAFEIEHRYMQAQLRQSKAFEQLLESVPEENDVVRRAMMQTRDSEPDNILSREKMARLKEGNPDLHAEVGQYLISYLSEQLGLE